MFRRRRSHSGALALHNSLSVCCQFLLLRHFLVCARPAASRAIGITLPANHTSHIRPEFAARHSQFRHQVVSLDSGKVSTSLTCRQIVRPPLSNTNSSPRHLLASLGASYRFRTRSYRALPPCDSKASSRQPDPGRQRRPQSPPIAFQPDGTLRVVDEDHASTARRTPVTPSR